MLVDSRRFRLVVVGSSIHGYGVGADRVGGRSAGAHCESIQQFRSGQLRELRSTNDLDPGDSEQLLSFS